MKESRYRYELAVQLDGGQVLRFLLPPGGSTVGRNSACEISIADASISRKHARFRVQGEVVTLEDLGSLNGTMVGGRKIHRPTRVTPADSMVLGELEARISRLGTEGERGVPEVWFQLLTPPGKGRTVQVASQRAVIGRSNTADIQINDGTISRAHAILRYSTEESRWYVEDRNSANGTFVDGVMVTETVLSGGEVLRLGDVELKFLGTQRPPPRRGQAMFFILLGLLGASIVLLLLSLFGEVSQ